MKQECKICIHYLPHFIINDTGQFRPIDGHCQNQKPNGRFRKTDKICEFYTERDFAQEKENQLKTATKCLIYMSKKINELSQILKIFSEETNTY